MDRTALPLLAALVACGRPDGRASDSDLAGSVARDLVSACPSGDRPDDVAARDRCADRLAALPSLRDLTDDPFVWGGQPADGSYRLDGNTRFAPLVWRRLYLSTFRLGPTWSVEAVGGLTVLHLAVSFRSGLPAGAYPYPFWHSDGKWESYSRSPTVHLVFSGGRLRGALRSVERDPSRPVEPRAWDGRWRWTDGSDAPMPYVSLYGYLLRPGNPAVARLEAAYRRLDSAMRATRCVACHSPDNRGRADQLELLSYPAQALSGRHRIVAQLEDDGMPPEGNALGMTPGIADPAERRLLLGLAREFAAAGDAALAAEGEPTP